LAHSKLYSKEQQALISILLNKLLKSVQEFICDIISSLPDGLADKIIELSTQGLLVELDISKQKNKTLTIKLYEVGEHEDMDNLFNNLENIISHVSFEVQLYK